MNLHGGFKAPDLLARAFRFVGSTIGPVGLGKVRLEELVAGQRSAGVGAATREDDHRGEQRNDPVPFGLHLPRP